MSIHLEHATPESLDEIVEAVATWQQDGVPVQLHPGDLGWAWRFGERDLAKEVWRGAATNRSWLRARRTTRRG